MEDLDLLTLRYFVAVCEAGNISRAAELESVVPSVVSKRIAQLETSYGVALLQRGRRGVSPTAAGECLVEHARSLIAGVERVSQEMAAFRSGVTGHVRILATASSIAEHLPDDVAAFLRIPEHRKIQVSIQEELSREVIRQIREGGASVGVLWDAADLCGLQSTPYRSDHLAAVVHFSHPLADMEDCLFTDTLPYDHVGLAALGAVRQMLAKGAAIAGVPLTYRATVSNFESALRVVRADLAISILPKEVAIVHAQAYDLRIVPLRDEWAVRQFAICYRSKEELSAAAAMLVNFLGLSARL